MRRIVPGRMQEQVKSEPAEPPKLFGRYQELVLLLIGFALTTVVGSFLTDQFQSRAWVREDRAKRQQEQMTRASAIYEEVSRLMDKRLFRLRTLQGALEQDATAEEVTNARVAYRAVVAEWNESLNRNLVVTEMYFGVDARNQLELDIADGFRQLQNQAIRTVDRPTKINLDCLQTGANDFNPHIYAFNQLLLARLQRGEIGTFRTESGSREAPHAVNSTDSGSMQRITLSCPESTGGEEANRPIFTVHQPDGTPETIGRKSQGHLEPGTAAAKAPIAIQKNEAAPYPEVHRGKGTGPYARTPVATLPAAPVEPTAADVGIVRDVPVLEPRGLFVPRCDSPLAPSPQACVPGPFGSSPRPPAVQAVGPFGSSRFMPDAASAALAVPR